MLNPVLSLKMITPLKDIDDYLQKEARDTMRGIALGLCELGRNCVRVAKNLPQGGSRSQYPAPYERLGDTKPNYTDWTTNLRRSIGWAVLRDGVEYLSDIGNVQTAREYYNEIKREYDQGIVLLVMATGQSPKDGRAYAGYVQALGYDVLSSSQLEMEQTAEQTIQKLING